MHFSRLAVLLVAVVAVACGSGSSGSGGNPGSGSSGGGSSSGGSGGSGSSGGGSSSGGSGAGSSGGSGGSTSSSSSGGSSSGGNPDAGVSDQSVTLTMGPFTVPGGSEVFKCQTFANPFGGKDVDVKEYEEHMTQGSHHMFVFFASGASDGAVGDCPNGGLQYGPYPFSAQTPDSTLTYPPTVGSHIPGSMGFMLNAHFLNAQATALQATLKVTFHLAVPGAVTQYAGVVFMNNLGITVPPGQSTATKTVTMPQDMKVILSASHMHQQATNFVATSGSQTLYTTPSWSNPVPATYDPPLDLPSGSPVTWSCTYDNNTNQTLTFGESALTNVMCIYTMQFYPISDPTNPTITFNVP
jgi:hypothetical protein